MVIYRFVSMIVVMNVLYELIEFIFPTKNMKTIVKSFTLIFFLYAICELIF